MFCLKRKSPGEAGGCHAVLLALAAGPAHRAPARRLDLDGGQEGPQGLSKGPAEKRDPESGWALGGRLQQLCPQVHRTPSRRKDTFTSPGVPTYLTRFSQRW